MVGHSIACKNAYTCNGTFNNASQSYYFVSNSDIPMQRGTDLFFRYVRGAKGASLEHWQPRKLTREPQSVPKDSQETPE